MTIVIKNLPGKIVRFHPIGQTVLQVLQDNGIDWMHSCGAKGRCTTCKFRIIQGSDNLSSLTSAERRYRDQKLLAGDERLACQARTVGDVELEVPDESKLPHISYSD
jgi:ferredoxin, 2Fe-2S